VTNSGFKFIPHSFPRFNFGEYSAGRQSLKQQLTVDRKFGTESFQPVNARVKEPTLRMLSGQTRGLIDELRVLAGASDVKAGARAVLERVASYYERNLACMRYDLYLAAGWPVATGVIEGACRHLVKDRCELSGMRWTKPGAQQLLHLRCVSENGDWEAFHAFLRGQRLSEQYGREPHSEGSSEPTAPARIASVPSLGLIDCQAA